MTHRYRGVGVPFPQADGGNPYPYVPAPQSQSYIEPGTMTFTKEQNKFGISEYCIYRAQPRTVMGPGGPVEGMQWILVEKMDKPPLDIVPAGPEVYATFGKSLSEANYQRNVKEWKRMVEMAELSERERATQEWEREQARMARQEQIVSARRIKEWEAERRMLDEEAWQEERMGHPQRRLGEIGFDNPYPRARSKSRGRVNSFGEEELTRQLAEMDMVDRYPAQARSRKISFADPAVARSEHGTRRRRASHSYGSNAALYDRGVPVGGPPEDEYIRYNKSPYPSEAQLARSREIPVYPRGHPREGEPIPGLADEDMYEDMYEGHSRMHLRADRANAEGWGNTYGSYDSHSPVREASSSSYRGHSPRPRSRSRRASIAGSASEFPVAFSRPPSNAVSYTPFKAFPVLRNLDSLLEDGIPPLPATLLPHDVHHEEWNLCMKQIDQAWSMQADLKRRDKMVSRVIDYWNAYFFNSRKAELILLKGSQRRSGSRIGLHDSQLGAFDDDSYIDDTESSISSDEFEIDEPFGWYTNYRYAQDPRMAQIIEAKRKRKEERRYKQERQRRHRKGKELPHSLYMVCLEDEEPYPYVTAHSHRSPYSSSSVPALI